MQYLVYILITIILGLLVVLSFIVGKLRHKKEGGPQPLPTPNTQNNLQVIEDAQRQANAIVEKAVESAKNILFETEYVKQDIAKEIQDSLQKVADETVKMVQGRSTESEQEFRTIVNEIKAQFSKEAMQKLDSIQKIAVDETEDFKKMLLKETVDSQQYVGQKINQDFQTALSEIQEYKKAKMIEVDQNIQDIIRSVVKDVLQTTVTLPIQEELVVEALEKAKRDELFKDLEEAQKMIKNPGGNVTSEKLPNETKPGEEKTTTHEA